jgi:RNA-directed DNA polymerase
MDDDVLRKWLQAGYIEKNRLYPTRKGTPQGGIISPTLANMTLDGLERVIREAVPRRSRVNFVRYADDFIITGKSRQLLERQVKPAVEAFLAERGLSLSAEKTMITYIKDGFTFLGQTFRKHGRVLHITPAKEGVLALIRKAGELIRTHVSAPMPYLIKKLNETLRGWGNYHRHVVASEAFSRIDTYVYEELWRMLRRRHSKKSRKWLARKYWLTPERKWVFTATGITKKGKRLYQVVRLGAIGIRRCIKVKADANPYLREYAFYFSRRRQDKESRLLPAMSAREYRAMAA